jgi:hypothetical protein
MIQIFILILKSSTLKGIKKLEFIFFYLIFEFVDRFSVEGKKTRDNCAYIPFGAGPRNCLGMRFAQMEMKLTLVKFLLKYEFAVSDQTPVCIDKELFFFI